MRTGIAPFGQTPRRTSPARPRPRRLWRPDGQTLGALALLAALAYLVVVPLATIVWGSVRTTPPGGDGGFTLDNLTTILGGDGVWSSLHNTGLFATASTVIAMVLGAYLAWVTERTDAPFRRAIYVFVMVPIVVPGILTTIAWALVLHEEIGLANVAVSTVTGNEVAPFDGYSLGGMIWADATDSITLPFLLIAAALRNMDPSLEEASRAAGASEATTLRRITLPVMRPALAATALIVFIKTVDSFEVPTVLGLPGGVRVLATDVYVATRRFPADPNLGAAYALLYLGVALVGLWAYHRVTRGAGRFVTIGGRGYRPARIALGSHRHRHGLAALTIVGVAVILPFLVVVYASLLPYYAPPSAGTWGQLTLDNYRYVLFEAPAVGRAVRNNLVAGLGASVVAVTLAALTSWVLVRGRSRLRGWLDAIAFAPIALPGIVLGLAVMWFYLTVPVPIYASLWIIGVAYVTAYLPYALRATHASMSQLDRELEESSAVAGARWGYTFWRITVPLISSGLVVGFIYVFSRTLKTLSLPVLLAGPGNEVLPVLIYDLYESGRYPELNALGVLMFVVLAVTGLALTRIGPGLGEVESRSWLRSSATRPNR